MSKKPIAEDNEHPPEQPKLRAPIHHHEEKKRIISSAAGWLTLFSWGGLFLAIILAHFARPESTYGFFGTYNETLPFRQQWHPTLTTWFVWSLWGCCIMTLISIITRVVFSQQALIKDKLMYNLVLLLFIVVVFIFAYYLDWLT